MIHYVLKKLVSFRNFYYKKRIKKIASCVGENLKVNGKSKVTTNTKLGNNVNFNGLIIQGDGEVKIGNNFHSGTEILIITTNHNYDKGKAIPYDERLIKKPVYIGDNVWLGSRVTILPGIQIGEGAIIQAGSVVTKNIPPCAIAGGHPINIFKYRNKEHYYTLKQQKKFH